MGEPAARQKVIERWRYDQAKALQRAEWQREPMTADQSTTLRKLLLQQPDIAREMGVLFGDTIEGWTQGQAVFAIACLRGDIQPTVPLRIPRFRWTPRQERIAALRQKLDQAYAALNALEWRGAPEPVRVLDPDAQPLRAYNDSQYADRLVAVGIVTLSEFAQCVESYGLSVDERKQRISFFAPGAPALGVPYRYWLDWLDAAKRELGLEWEAYVVGPKMSPELLQSLRIERELSAVVQLLESVRVFVGLAATRVRPE